MPTLDILERTLDETALYLLGVMLSPRDSQGVDSFVSGYMGTALINLVKKVGVDKLNKNGKSELQKALSGNALTEWFKKHDGCFKLGGVLKCEMSAHILVYVLALAQHEPKKATLETVYSEIGSAFGKAGYRGASRAYLAKIWAEKSPSAHISAARLIAADKWNSGTREGMLWVLNTADDLREMGERHRLSRQGGRTLLNAEETWKLPSELRAKPVTINMPTKSEIRAQLATWPKRPR